MCASYKKNLTVFDMDKGLNWSDKNDDTKS